MTEQTRVPAEPRVLGAGDGKIIPSIGSVSNRFMIDGREAGGRFTLLQHLFEPNALAAPMHRHHDEDEYTYVLSGQIGEPAVVLEIISPAGLEELFRSFEGFTAPPDPQTLAAMAAKYRCDLDFDATFPIIERHGLVF